MDHLRDPLNRHCSTCTCPNRVVLSPFDPGCTLEALEANVTSILITLAHARRQRNALLPVSQLPPEVLVEVFRYHRDQPSPRWIFISHVSHSWRTIALADRSLWRKIDLRYLRGAQEVVPRAPNSLFRLFLSIPSSIHPDVESIQTLPPLIKTVAGTISAIDLRGPMTSISNVLQAISGSLGNLTEVELEASQFTSNTMFGFPQVLLDNINPSHLCALVLVKYMLPWDSPLIGNDIHLRRLRLEFPRDAPISNRELVIGTLRSLVELRELCLKLALPPWDVLATPSDGPLEPSIDLPSLEYLHLDDNVEDALFFARHLRISPQCRTSFVVAEASGTEHSEVLLLRTFKSYSVRYSVSPRSQDIGFRSYSDDSRHPRHYLRICQINSYVPYLRVVFDHNTMVTGDFFVSPSTMASVDTNCWDLLFRCCPEKPLHFDVSLLSGAGAFHSLFEALAQGDFPVHGLVISGVNWDDIDISTLFHRLKEYAQRNSIPSIRLRIQNGRNFPEDTLGDLKSNVHKSFEMDGEAYALTITYDEEELENTKQ